MPISKTDVLVVERRAGTSTVPRATGVSTRTMELFRFWGVARAVRAGSIDCDPRVSVTHTLAAAPAELLPFHYPSVREALAVSPAYPAICSPDHIEPVLAAEIRRLGGEIRFGTALTALRSTPGARAELGPGGEGVLIGPVQVLQPQQAPGVRLGEGGHGAQQPLAEHDRRVGAGRGARPSAGQRPAPSTRLRAAPTGDQARLVSSGQPSSPHTTGCRANRVAPSADLS